MEHGGEFPDTMPQAIKMTDAEGRSCVYVPVTQDDKVVDSSDWGVRDARLASVPLSIRNRSSLALLIFMALLFRTRPPWPRQPRACVNGARYDIISLLGRSVTLVTFHSVGDFRCCPYLQQWRTNVPRRAFHCHRDHRLDLPSSCMV